MLGSTGGAGPGLFARVPPTLERLVARSNCTVAAADLRALFGPGTIRLPKLSRIELDTVPGEAFGFEWDDIQRGAVIDLAHPVLQRTGNGKPVFAPLPGWVLPDWDNDDDFGETKALKEAAKRTGVELVGRLVECVEVQEAYDDERRKCRLLRARHDAGELEWEPWRGQAPASD